MNSSRESPRVFSRYLSINSHKDFSMDSSTDFCRNFRRDFSVDFSRDSSMRSARISHGVTLRIISDISPGFYRGITLKSLWGIF